MQRFPCDRKLCTECSPLRRARKVENYLGHMCATGGEWYFITVSDEVMGAVAKRIARAGAKFVKVPAPNQRRTVLTNLVLSTSIGADEHAYREALTRTFDVEPADGPNVSASKGWAEPRPDSNGEWELEGMVKASIAKVRYVAAEMGVLRAVVDEAFLPWGGEAVILDDTSPLWDDFCERIGLFWPERRLRAVA